MRTSSSAGPSSHGARRDPLDTSYRVMRATYTDVRLGLSRPDVTASGLPLEGRPTVGAPGDERVAKRRPARHEGLHRDRDDPRPLLRRQDGATRRALRVPGGGGDAFGREVRRVECAGRPGPASGARPRRHVASRRAAATMRRLPDDPATRRATLRRLARLRRAAPPGSDRALYVERLERRVRYAGSAEAADARLHAHGRLARRRPALRPPSGSASARGTHGARVHAPGVPRARDRPRPRFSRRSRRGRSAVGRRRRRGRRWAERQSRWAPTWVGTDPRRAVGGARRACATRRQAAATPR
jgi:hypothetical protein